MCKINVKRFFERLWERILWVYVKYISPYKPEPQPEPIIEEPKPPWFGCSIYELIQMEIELIKAFLKQLKKAGGNATEIFLVHSHDGNMFQPYSFDMWEMNTPVFNLDVWNETFWDNFRYFLTACKDLGIVPFIRIHDQCSVKNPERAKFYCFLQNKQGFKTIFDKGLYLYYSRLNQRILEELNIASIETFFIIPMNETDGSSKEVYDFHEWYVKDLTGK